MLVNTMTNLEVYNEMEKCREKVFYFADKLTQSLYKDAIRRKFKKFTVYKDIKELTVNRNKFYVVAFYNKGFKMNISTILDGRIITYCVGNKIQIHTKHFISRYKERSSFCSLFSDNILISLCKEFVNPMVIRENEYYHTSKNGLFVGIEENETILVSITYMEGDYSSKIK